MICKGLEPFLHPSFRVNMASYKEDEKEDKDSSDDAPFYSICSLQLD